MEQVAPFVPECPNCGAPLDLARLHQGMVKCGYCGNAVALRSIPQLAADPALARKVEEEALPPTLFDKLLGRNFALFAGLAAGFALVFAWFVFRRQPHDDEIPACLFAAVGAVCALGWKRRLYAAALALGVGGLVAAKPFLRPIVDSDLGYAYSPTSETALYFVVPGALLIGLAVVVVLRIRPARLKTDLALLRPRPLAALGVAVGAGLGLLAFAGPTNRDALAEHGPLLDARARQYGMIVAWIDAPGRPALPTSAAGLSPPPSFVADDPRSNVDIVPIDAWNGRSGSVPLDLYLAGYLSHAIERRAEPWWRDDWDRDDDLVSVELPAAAATRYLVAYRCDKHESGEPVTGCALWMFSLDTSAPLFARALPEPKEYADAEGYLLSQLAEATQGTFVAKKR
jgi:hypothetical protein